MYLNTYLYYIKHKLMVFQARKQTKTGRQGTNGIYSFTATVFYVPKISFLRSPEDKVGGVMRISVVLDGVLYYYYYYY
jgi:hypothetical protein